MRPLSVLVGVMLFLSLFNIAAANASSGPYVSHAIPVYETVTTYENVTTCTKGKDQTTTGAIYLLVVFWVHRTVRLSRVPSLVPSLAMLANNERCTTERVATGTYQKLIGWRIWVTAPDGGRHLIEIPARP